MKKWKLLIADDHEMVLDGLAALLEAEKGVKVMGRANDGEEVMEKLRAGSIPDLLILDINMPQMDGEEVVNAVKPEWTDIKILILSMHSHGDYVGRFTRAGVDGYILKSSGMEELKVAIRTIKNGGTYFSEELLREAADSGVSDGEPYRYADLSSREKEVLMQMAQGKNSRQIAGALHISKHTVDSHRKNIAAKLKTNKTADMIMYAVRSGVIKDYDLQ